MSMPRGSGRRQQAILFMLKHAKSGLTTSEIATVLRISGHFGNAQAKHLGEPLRSLVDNGFIEVDKRVKLPGLSGPYHNHYRILDTKSRL